MNLLEYHHHHNQVNPVFNKPFEELTEAEKQQLSLTYGLGIPTGADIEPVRDEDGNTIEMKTFRHSIQMVLVLELMVILLLQSLRVV